MSLGVPPLESLSWEHYQPDIVGFKQERESLELAIIECKTSPSMYRISDKTHRIKEWFSIQERLNKRSYLKLLLVIPPRKLNRVNLSSIRKIWKIWIMNRKGRLLCII